MIVGQGSSKHYTHFFVLIVRASCVEHVAASSGDCNQLNTTCVSKHEGDTKARKQPRKGCFFFFFTSCHQLQMV